MSILKKFEVTTLNVPGAEIYNSPVYGDHRGSLFEAFHCLKFDTDCSVNSVKGIYPYMHQVYGPSTTNGDEVIYIIRGKVFCVLIDPKNTSVKDILELVPGKVLKIPSETIRVFLGMEEKTIYDIVRTSGDGSKKYFKLDDPILAGIEFPEPLDKLTQADLMGPTEDNLAPKVHPDFAIMGSNGLIGSSFVDGIEAAGMTWAPIKARLHQHEMIKNEILALKPNVSVIIAAGVGTRPNTKWCDTHHQETIDCNVTSQAAIVKICKEVGVHCTIIGTTGFYSYDAEHPIGGKGFVEEDKPNHCPNFYFKCRELLEDLLKKSGDDKYCLNLRAVFPIGKEITSATIIGKLLRFNTVFSIPSSITVLPTLVPLALKMMKDKEVGNINWVCDGVMSNGDILRLYKEIVDPKITINEKIVNAEDNWAMGASAQYAVPQRLINKFGSVPQAKDALSEVLKNLKQ